MDNIVLTKEKLRALLVRLFIDGHKGRSDFYQRITDCPDSIEKTIQNLKSKKCSKSQIVVKSCDLLAILKDAFQEGKASYPEMQESVIQQLMESVTKPSNENSMEQHEKKFQKLLFNKWAIIEDMWTMNF